MRRTAKTDFVLSAPPQVLLARHGSGDPFRPDEFKFVIHTTPCLIRIDDRSVPMA
jgi:hypothetical protein